MSRKNVAIPFALVTDKNLSPTAKVVYAVLKSFHTDKTVPYSDTSIIVTHGEIVGRSNLSKHTVAKALNSLESNGWIEGQRNIGSPNRYFFTTPASNL